MVIDLICSSVVYGLNYIEYRVDNNIEVPEGYIGLFFSKKESHKKNLLLINNLYTGGEIIVYFKVLEENANYLKYDKIYVPGEIVASLLLVKLAEIKNI